MAIAVRTNLVPDEIRILGEGGAGVAVGDLADLQNAAYERFLQLGVGRYERSVSGLESIFREVFPIVSFDGATRLEYQGYELGKARYNADECRQLRLTYGRPCRVFLRLIKDTVIDEEVYVGDFPIMLGGGEFVINGAERVVVSQLHRSPGVDFVGTAGSTDRKSFSGRLIPERGSWIELNVTKRDALSVRIDQSGRFSATTLLRAMDKSFSSNSGIAKRFYKLTEIKSHELKVGDVLGEDLILDDGPVGPGEILIEFGSAVTESHVARLLEIPAIQVQVLPSGFDPLVINTLRDDASSSHEEALLRIYQRLRPGNPPSLEKARELFDERFFDAKRYRLGVVGRFRLNRKLGLDRNGEVMALHPDDYAAAVEYFLRLRGGDSTASIDDIDNLGNRRLRTIDELAAEELRKGLLKVRRTAQERMAIKDAHELSPRTLVNPKSISAAIEFFFGRSELSQVVDQTNPLSMLTHERRLSALGPGGLNRKRAGFEVRDVHISHYGRICPVETPEGTNIGLISSLALFARVDSYGFLTTPYMKVLDGVVLDTVIYVRADEECDAYIIPADTPVEGSKLRDSRVLARYKNDVVLVDSTRVAYMDVSPAQMVGVSASLIPFLEHDDANRALMGSNMQRQAVPLLIPEAPLVGTGVEAVVARHSGMVPRSPVKGIVEYVDSTRIVIGGIEVRMRKFVGLNERTCLTQRPVVRLGQKVAEGEPIADSAATSSGELSLGRNVLVAFMSFDGYNFEDAIILSERLVQIDAYTSIHIDEFDVEIRETKLGREEFTRDIPNVGEKVLRNLDERGIVRIGTRVEPGDVLVGKVSPKAKAELTPEEKLLHAIFGRAGEDVKNESLEVPSGVDGTVIHTEHFRRKMSLTETERKDVEADVASIEAKYDSLIAESFRSFLGEFEKVSGESYRDDSGHAVTKMKEPASVARQAEKFLSWFGDAETATRSVSIKRLVSAKWGSVEAVISARDSALSTYRRGEELQNGVMQMVKVYVASKRAISVGDKMAGRHGNKGVISKILPIEDMPYMADGTSVEIILNPLGVPSRMNVGQILETHLGWAASRLRFRAVCPVFNGPTEEQIRGMLTDAGLPEDGKTELYDGRTGERLEQKTTVGYIYMLKLHHLVDDKIHARATGPYSLITQQPLGGKARFGGQRFGEMEVWALEAYGAAYILQELLTVKSDDVEGRTKIYESMVKGENTLEAGTPASFDVLTNEIRGLALSLTLAKT